MQLDFTKIKWAGSSCILVTNRDECYKPLVILNHIHIEEIVKEFAKRGDSE